MILTLTVLAPLDMTPDDPTVQRAVTDQAARQASAWTAPVFAGVADPTDVGQPAPDGFQFLRFTTDAIPRAHQPVTTRNVAPVLLPAR